jgi:hypothetical protein
LVRGILHQPNQAQVKDLKLGKVTGKTRISSFTQEIRNLHCVLGKERCNIVALRGIPCSAVL